MLTCDIAGHAAAADIKWIDPEGNDIPDGDSTNYIVDDGKSGYSAGSQTTELTLKEAVVSAISSAKTYKCSAESGYFPGSGSFESNVVVTPLGEHYIIGVLLYNLREKIY